MTGYSLNLPSLMSKSSHKSIISPSPILLLLLSLLSLQFSTVFAQEILDFGILPACAGACPSLTDAQTNCIPPAVPAADQTAYESCFCQSAFLQPLFTSPNGVCDAFCAQPELDRIWGWFTDLCQNGVEPVDEDNDGGEDNIADDAPPVVTDVEQPSPTPLLFDTDEDDGESGSWVSNNWEWIVFLVILVLSIIFFSVLGVWLKRRYRRKRDLAGANLAAPEAVMPETREIHTSQSATLPSASPVAAAVGAAVGAGAAKFRTRRRTLSIGTGAGGASGTGAGSVASRDSTIIMPDMSSQLHLPVPAPSKSAWSVSSRPNSRPPSRVWTPDGNSSIGGAGGVRTHSRVGSITMMSERMGNAGLGEAANGGRRSSTPSGGVALAESSMISENTEGYPASSNGNGVGSSSSNGNSIAKAKERVDGAPALGGGNMRHGGSKLRE